MCVYVSITHTWSWTDELKDKWSPCNNSWASWQEISEKKTHISKHTVGRQIIMQAKIQFSFQKKTTHKTSLTWYTDRVPVWGTVPETLHTWTSPVLQWNHKPHLTSSHPSRPSYSDIYGTFTHNLYWPVLLHVSCGIIQHMGSNNQKVVSS